MRVECGSSCPPALVRGQALLCARGSVVALVDGRDVLAVSLQHLQEQGIDGVSQKLHAYGAHLRDERLLVAIYHEPRETVCLAEHHATAVGIGCFAAAHGAQAHGAHAVAPGPFELAVPEGLVHAVVGVARHDAHANLALLGEEPCALPGAILLKHVDYAAVCGLRAVERRWLYAQHLALEYPRVPRGERPRGFARHDDLRVGA